MHRRAFLALPAAAYATSKELQNRLRQHLEKLTVFDTHEHILPETERVKQKVDFFTLASHYLLDDLTAAGLPEKDRALIEDSGAPGRKRWSVFEPFWKHVRQSGYGEALRIAMRDVYGVTEMSGATLGAINESIASKNRIGFYREVLKDRARIAVAINDEYWQQKPGGVDPEFFALARKFDWFVAPVTRAGLQRLEGTADASITSLEGLKGAMEKHFELGLKLGMVTVKSTLAYERDLNFSTVSPAEARADFAKLVKAPAPSMDPLRRLERRPFRALSDHMFHHVIRLADAHKIPLQIHTGLQAGNGNYVWHTRPSQLTNLFLQYPGVRFDLFHIGYPYYEEAAVLAKMFANVYVDFCWMHVVAPSASRTALHHMLDSVPSNKIFGFGGDYRYPELSYGHLVIARNNLTRVLAERVEAGDCSEEEAFNLGRSLLYDNPANLFLPNSVQRA